jgi:hypothetical protein
MATITDAADRGEFDRTDRILLGTCAAVWLVALGAAVAATVALVDLGSHHGPSAGGTQTPWLLYAVIAVSAAVIIGAVPLLLRARRAALEEAPPTAPPPISRAETPTEKLRVPPPARVRSTSPPPNPSAAAINQLSLRCAVLIAIAMGVALVAIGVATYLMAIDHDAVSWGCYVLAGLVTVGMPGIPWFYLRELRTLTPNG